MMDEKRLQELIDQYTNVYLFATKKLERLLVEKAMPLSLEQFGILRVLHIRGQTTAGEIARESDVHKSAVTTKIARLEKLGFVRRTSDPEDRRSRVIALTDEGSEAFETCRRAVTSFITPFFEKLSEEELETFLRVYSKLNTMLEEDQR
ncbi:MarR family winged helix-turn-helix transcriptional regulator [Alkalicoccus urumqiensis]|uniref:HTH marR-type domain-containing protein n=1 Tax=Alkalicoccus urumqiensis TaxID=1548213 RepID=A0A2P6MF96_ALKUR|nr:MarR family transcriptional regulator [Alkalicoccus urumqiensis]PRO64943.1 hypothetical protein C6I21_12430 [Alkalicoccus urumqiensis]